MKKSVLAARALAAFALLLSISVSSSAAESLYDSVSERIQGTLPGAVAPVPVRALKEAKAAEGAPYYLAAPGRGGQGPAMTNIPGEAKAFLPDYMTQAAPNQLWPMDSSVVRERADELAVHFTQFYPGITYHIDWDDETVNAYAWKSGNERHVALKGGLLRHKALKIQAVALVLAHEIGHHYGGEPTYWSGLSCEGQADYWGGGVGMRTAYADNYREMMEPAIEQIHKFFSKGITMTLSPAEQLRRFSEEKGCSHPPAACRKATYTAAMNGEPKPDCAGIVAELTAS